RSARCALSDLSEVLTNLQQPNHGRKQTRPRDPSPGAQDDGFLEAKCINSTVEGLRSQPSLPAGEKLRKAAIFIRVRNGYILHGLRDFFFAHPARPHESAFVATRRRRRSGRSGFGMPRATRGVRPRSGLKDGGRFFSSVRAKARPADI